MLVESREALFCRSPDHPISRSSDHPIQQRYQTASKIFRAAAFVPWTAMPGAAPARFRSATVPFFNAARAVLPAFLTLPEAVPAASEVF
jgi:hypothetical protein